MLYAKHITVKPEHTKDNKLIEYLEVEGDFISKVVIYADYATKRLVNVQIFYGEDQIIPENTGETVRPSGFPIEARLHYDLPELKPKLKIVAWGENCMYEHLVSIYIEVRRYADIFKEQGFKNIFGITL